jgi:hypothetical protein
LAALRLFWTDLQALMIPLSPSSGLRSCVGHQPLRWTPCPAA